MVGTLVGEVTSHVDRADDQASQPLEAAGAAPLNAVVARIMSESRSNGSDDCHRSQHLYLSIDLLIYIYIYPSIDQLNHSMKRLID